jgi:flagellar hook-basal body protein
MVTRSLFTGVSGLQAHQQKMDTISNNVSNINTPGYKKSQTVFKSFLSQTLSSASQPTAQSGGTNPQQVGLGVQVGAINKDMGQGQLQRTGVNTDLAIQGEGFFEVRESGGNRSLFTRSGSFQIDADGRLVDPSTGNVVQGFNSTVEDGRIQFNPETATVEDIQIGNNKEVIPGSATTMQELSGNLAANAEQGIDPITVEFSGGGGGQSQVRFDFERYHPTEKLYRFTAKWTQNPPSGKQIGDNVVDQVTGRELQGIMELNDDLQVTNLYENPDRAENIGATRVEVDRNNAGSFNISEEDISARDQSDFMNDLAPDITDQFRMRFIDNADSGDPDGDTDADEFIIEWQDSDGGWNQFTNMTNALDGEEYGQANEAFTLKRDSGGGDSRVGEIRIGEGFWNDMDTSTIQGGDLGDNGGDKIYFQAQTETSNGLLNLTGEEGLKEFQWGGNSSTGVGSFRTSEPVTTSGSGSLSSVFNFDEANLGLIGDTTTQNDIPNKEFNIDFGANASDDEFEVTSPGFGGTITNQVGDEEMSRNMDNVLYTEASSTVSGGGSTDTTININDGDASLFSAGETIRIGDETRTIESVTSTAAGSPDELELTTALSAAPGGGIQIGKQLGISLSSENFNNTEGSTAPSGGTEIDFQLTQARSNDTSRPFMIASDGSGNNTALFGPSGRPNAQPSAANFAPNLNDTSGIFDNTTDSLLASNGTGATADPRTDDAVQVATSSDVFDSLGDQHTLTYRFEKKDTNEWMWHVKDPTPVDSGDPKIAGFGRLEFDDSGNLLNSESFNAKTAQELPPPGPDGDLNNSSIYFNPPAETLQSDPADPDNENQDVGADPVEILPDFSNVTQFAGETDAEISDQDGSSRGRLQQLSFDSSGVLNGSYDNGQSKQLAQIVLADFRNPGGLEKAGNTTFAQSANSGIPTRGTAGAGGRGTITPGALERSNVDLSAQFTELISTQRGFQANTRTITTSDQLIQSVLQLA